MSFCNFWSLISIFYGHNPSVLNCPVSIPYVFKLSPSIPPLLTLSNSDDSPSRPNLNPRKWIKTNQTQLVFPTTRTNMKSRPPLPCIAAITDCSLQSHEGLLNESNMLVKEGWPLLFFFFFPLLFSPTQACSEETILGGSSSAPSPHLKR